MITFLYKRRPDDTFVIEHQNNPYHVIEDDPLYAQCVEEYEALEVLPPDEPLPEPLPEVADARIKTVAGDYQAGLAEVINAVKELDARVKELEGIG